jgi:hypothetical protein
VSQMSRTATRPRGTQTQSRTESGRFAGRRIKCTPRVPAAGERCREGEAVDVEDHEPVARHRHEADAEPGQSGGAG